MNWESTKLDWAGDTCILLTDRDTRNSIILTGYEIRMLIKEWGKK